MNVQIPANTFEQAMSGNLSATKNNSAAKAGVNRIQFLSSNLKIKKITKAKISMANLNMSHIHPYTYSGILLGPFVPLTNMSSFLIYTLKCFLQ